MDLTTKWLGLELRNPFVPSASPLTKCLDTARRLEDAGAGALIMHSLYEEAVMSFDEDATRFLHHQDTGNPMARGNLAAPIDFPCKLDCYLEQLSSLKASLGIPVVASLNGVTPGGWVEHAKELQDAGADALELNVYHVAADPEESGFEVEERYLNLLELLEDQINIPINMKLGPFFSSPAHMICLLEPAGAAGVSIFNRFFQPDINIETLRLVPTLHPSTSTETLLAVRWIAILYGRSKLSLGATGGVHTAEDVIKLLLAGADVVHLCSSLLQHGPSHLGALAQGLEQWMDRQGFGSIAEVRGRMSQHNVADPSEFVRANYMMMLDGFSPDAAGGPGM